MTLKRRIAKLEKVHHSQSVDEAPFRFHPACVTTEALLLGLAWHVHEYKKSRAYKEKAAKRTANATDDSGDDNKECAEMAARLNREMAIWIERPDKFEEAAADGLKYEQLSQEAVDEMRQEFANARQRRTESMPTNA